MSETITLRTSTEKDVIKIVERGPQGASSGGGTGSVTSVALASSDLTITGSPITSSGTITANLSNSGATAGTYTKVTVDAKGRVTSGATATAADIGAAPATGIDPTAISGTAVVDSDARLSDTRDPNPHAQSHQAGEADELFDQSLNQADSPTFDGLTITDTDEDGAIITNPETGNFIALNNPTNNSNFAFSNNLQDDLTLVDPNSNGVLFYLDRRPEYGDSLVAVYAKDASEVEDAYDPAFKVGVDGTIKAKKNLVLKDKENDATATFDVQDKLTENRTYSLPDRSGELALVSDITKTAIGLGNVSNNAQTQAAIVPNTAPSAGQVLVGNAGGTAYAPASVSGDLTLSSTGAATIANNAVTNAKLAQVATSTLKGRVTASTGNVEDLTASQVRTLLNVADGATANSSDATLLARANHTGTQAASTITGLATIATSGSASDLGSGTVPIARIPTGTSSTTVALGDHTHSQLHDRSHAMTGTSDHTATAWRAFYSNGSGQVTEIALGAANTVLTSNGASSAPSFAAVSAGATNLWIPASAWIPRTTNGCGVNSLETSTNKVNYDVLEFDAAAVEYAQAAVVMPSNWNAGTVTCKFHWTAASGSGSVVWQLSGRSYGDNAALDAATGTVQTVTDALQTAAYEHITAATSAITLAGSPAAGQMVIFELSRLATDAADTLAVDGRFLGAEISFN